MKLFIKAMIKFILGIVMFSALLFIPAGTIEYINAWVFMGVLFVPIFFIIIILSIKAPELLEKRLNVNEKEKEQKIVILLSVIILIVAFIVAGLDFKYGWTEFDDKVIIFSSIAMFLGYGLYAEVMRENKYLSRNVEVQENQVVIDKGLYGIIRHPMYLATIIMYLSMPLVLGSIYSFYIFLLFPVVLIKRIINEEKVLEEGLKGYKEYKEKVKYRLIPFIW